MVLLPCYSVIENEAIEQVAGVLGALGNRTRLGIVKLIAGTDKPLHIKALSRALKVRHSAIYRHVVALKKAGIVTVHEVGRSRVVALRHQKKLNGLLRIATPFTK
jgi:DNA-binding transcriptional ArsR family regulator